MPKYGCFLIFLQIYLATVLGCDGISSSRVSRICEQLYEVVESFLGRPLDGGPTPTSGGTA